MIPEIENLTGNNIDEYSELCQNIVEEFPQLDELYSVVTCVFVTSSSSNSYRQKMSQLRFSSHSLPRGLACAFSSGRRGAIVVRVDLLESKEQEFQDFVIAEECSHLVEQEGSSNPSSNSFQQFDRDYMRRGNNFQKAAFILNENFTHFTVNRMLIERNFDQWLTYRRTQYGPDFRGEKFRQFCRSISGLTAEEQTAILSVELLKVVSFYRVVQNRNSQEVSTEKKLILDEMENSLEETIETMEQTARRIMPNFPDILPIFTEEVFEDEQIFWNSVLGVWYHLGI